MSMAPADPQQINGARRFLLSRRPIDKTEAAAPSSFGGLGRAQRGDSPINGEVRGLLQCQTSGFGEPLHLAESRMSLTGIGGRQVERADLGELGPVKGWRDTHSLVTA